MVVKKVLVIDDNPVIIRMDESLLDKLGYEIISAQTGLEGLEKAEKLSPDLILLDIILPEMHGFEICKKLKQNESTKNIPIIIVTGTGLEDVVNNEPDLQVEGYISKPYGFEELKSVLDKIVKTE